MEFLTFLLPVANFREEERRRENQSGSLHTRKIGKLPGGGFGDGNSECAEFGHFAGK